MNDRSDKINELSVEEKRELLTRLLLEKKQTEFIPLSYGQQSLWFVHQLAPESAAYNLSFAVRITSNLNINALRETFQELLDRHSVLRTTFHLHKDQPVQKINRQMEVSFEEIDAAKWPPDYLNDWLIKEAHQPFDLENGPLLRVHLLTQSPREHILLLNVHHIAVDLWSLVIIVEEISLRYRSKTQGTQVTLPALKLQFRDFVRWQRSMLESEQGEKLWQYWQQQLGGELPVLNLPLDHPRPAVQSYIGESRSFKIDQELADNLKSLVRTNQTTLYTLLLAAFQVLLYRYTGQHDILIGSPAAGRSHAGLENIVGYFVNPIVIRADLSGAPTFNDFLARTRTTVLNALDHQDLLFPLLVERLQPTRDASRSPLFQVMFVLEKPHRFNEIAQFVLGEAGAMLDLGGLEIESLGLEQHVSQFDLTLVMAEKEDGISALLQYNTELFEPITVIRIIEHYCNLLASIVADPACAITQLPILSKVEREQLIFEWNNTKRPYPLEQTLLAGFELQIERHANALALVFNGQSITYQQLNNEVNCLARYLQNQGLDREATVCLYLSRSSEMVIAMLAVLKAGGAYVPLDPAYASERLSYIMADVGASVLITRRSLTSAFSHYTGKIICLDADRTAIIEAGNIAPEVMISGEELACVIYTSGSTGKPKGAMITHRGLANHAQAIIENFQLQPGDRLLQFASVAFDVAGEEIFPALLCGATVVIWPERMPVVADLLNFINEHCITVINLPARYWQELCAELSNSELHWPEVVRLVVIGSEPVEIAAFNYWQQRVGSSVRTLNAYGLTETTITSTLYEPNEARVSTSGYLPIGKPIGNTTIYILDGEMQPVAIGVAGEIYIGGAGVARGYLNREELTAERFITDPFSKQEGARLYRTGDMGRYLLDGNIEYLGRVDQQVKIRGYRIELGEIESVLRQHNGVKECVVLASGAGGEQRLIGYVTLHREAESKVSELREYLQSKLPSYMLPSMLVVVAEIPLTSNGKIDRRALLAMCDPETATSYIAPQTELEQAITAIWQDLLHVEKVGLHDNFFELGGHSLLLIQLHSKLQRLLNRDLPITELFHYPTINSLATHLTGMPPEKIQGTKPVAQASAVHKQTTPEIAVIGMAGRFPGADTIESFWQNLAAGVESISLLSDQDLITAGVSEDEWQRADYVRAKGCLKDIELFDAEFFGFSAREAEITDPQHRLFLESAWQALETAGYQGETYTGNIGVFAGAGVGGYLLNIYSNPEIFNSAGMFQLISGNDKDYLATRVSYKLNLKGASISVQTACSTSLVAVHLACQSLINQESDMALAGGVSIIVPQAGYLYEEGGILSPDGHCRAFDREAGGTVSGSGVAILVLKRLTDAIADGDTIHAVIKGSAINNDGSLKVGYTAPSIDGQAQVIARAQAIAGVDAESITYLEAHGTGTILGDPIEVAALNKAFRTNTEAQGFCAIGSLKTNIGHLDAAAGAAGLIKAILALKNGQIPPSLNFTAANTNIDFANSPFYVNTKLTEWPTAQTPRRAGVSSFGIGGTNAHVIVEEAPALPITGESRCWQLLTLSARSAKALEQASNNLRAFLADQPVSSSLSLADVAFTLQIGRKDFSHRRTIVCRDINEAIAALTSHRPEHGDSAIVDDQTHPVAFMFAGQGTQYVNMARELYEQEPLFREQVDYCCRLLDENLNLSLCQLLYPATLEEDATEQRLTQTAITQPALFVIEYALARLLMHWGVQPQVMIGHSVGEYVAACLAGVFSLEDALTIVAERGRLIQSLPPGAMLSVSLSYPELLPLLGEDLSLAAINGPASCVVSGPIDAISKLATELDERGLLCHWLHTSHAFHSQMLTPILAIFSEVVGKVALKRPVIPFISCVTGEWIKETEAMDADYWVRHLRQTVQFDKGLTTLLSISGLVCLEVGPGRTLSALVKHHPLKNASQSVFATLRHAQEEQSDLAFLMNTLGNLWLAGIKIDWAAFYAGERRRRIPLPTYPFERKRYWVARRAHPLETIESTGVTKQSNIGDWYYLPGWQQALRPQPASSSEATRAGQWLIFADECGFAKVLKERLQEADAQVIMVSIGTEFKAIAANQFTIDPTCYDDYQKLLAKCNAQGVRPQRIIHCWSITNGHCEQTTDIFTQAQNRGFYSLIHLARALAAEKITDALQLEVISNQVQIVSGNEHLLPEKATLLGACQVIPQEYANIACRHIDILIPAGAASTRLLTAIVDEISTPATERMVAYRGHNRWVRRFLPLKPPLAPNSQGRLRKGGVYLIVGGLGDIGLTLATWLAQSLQARLALTSRTPLPPRATWPPLRTTDGQTSGSGLDHKLWQLQEMERIGGEILTITADVTNRAEMEMAIAQIQQQWGTINGVIFAAGNSGSQEFDIGQSTSPQSFAAQIAVKRGVSVLADLLRGEALDFCLVISSLSSLLGGVGLAGYAAASCFLDAFVQSENQLGDTPWTSVNLDNWLLKPEYNEQLTDKTLAQLTLLAMSRTEGLQALQSVMAHITMPQIAISTADLTARSQQALHKPAAQPLGTGEKRGTAGHVRPDLASAYVAPRDQREALLAGIWQELLGVEPIGRDDNFFQLGGDSVVGLRIIAKASQAGLQLTPKQIFQCQTVAELAAVAGTITSYQESSLPVTGLLPLTPIQHWFFDQHYPEPHHWNQSVLLEVTAGMEMNHLIAAIQYLINHHDALRLHYRCENGVWQQVYDQTGAEAVCHYFDLTVLAESERTHALKQEMARLQASLDLTIGPLIRVALFKLGGQQRDRLMVVMHHLIIDTVSWQILLTDLSTIYDRLINGLPIVLPAKSSSLQAWAQELVDYAHSTNLQAELAYWLDIVSAQNHYLPRDLHGENSEQSARRIVVQLDANQTELLLREASQAYNTQISDLLLAALTIVCNQWTGQDELYLELEAMGREDLFDKIDLSRTVGWFTTVFPVRLKSAINDVGATIRSVKEELRRIPKHGIGYGVLRYLAGNTPLNQWPSPELIFLYLGQLDHALSQSSLFQIASEACEPNRSPQAKRSHLIEINSYISGGQLSLHWHYSENIHHHTTIERLANNYITTLSQLINHCFNTKTLGYTPSDFPLAGLNQDDLDDLLQELGLTAKEN